MQLATQGRHHEEDLEEVSCKVTQLALRTDTMEQKVILLDKEHDKSVHRIDLLQSMLKTLFDSTEVGRNAVQNPQLFEALKAKDLQEFKNEFKNMPEMDGTDLNIRMSMLDMEVQALSASDDSRFHKLEEKADRASNSVELLKTEIHLLRHHQDQHETSHRAALAYDMVQLRHKVQKCEELCKGMKQDTSQLQDSVKHLSERIARSEDQLTPRDSLQKKASKIRFKGLEDHPDEMMRNNSLSRPYWSESCNSLADIRSESSASGIGSGSLKKNDYRGSTSEGTRESLVPVVSGAKVNEDVSALRQEVQLLRMDVRKVQATSASFSAGVRLEVVSLQLRFTTELDPKNQRKIDELKQKMALLTEESHRVSLLLLGTEANAAEVTTF